MFKLNHKTVLNLIFIFALPSAAYAEQYCTGGIERTNSFVQFQDNGDGTVTDRATRLMWQKCADGQGADCSGEPTLFTWMNAFARATTLNNTAYAGYSDWRLPNAKELLSIAERSCVNPAIDLIAFPNTGQDASFWSSTTLTGYPQSIMRVNFLSGDSDPYSKTSTLQLRLVRELPPED
ncbi:MAG: DUF1566 domain-containing protein [Thiolinea sp.]